MINPDGVDDGHWRHNRHGIDLNRDWAYFRQPETRVVSTELEKLRGRQVEFAIDFHSTFKDIFYVLQDDVPVSHKGLSAAWIQDIAAAFPDYAYRVQPVTNDVPAAHIWLARTFGINTVTYEVGDETDRPRMRAIARAAAQALMKRLL
jgi:predicted deacylase